MDMNQTVNISLEEYLKLKEAYEKRNEAKIEKSTTRNLSGNELVTSAGLSWYLLSDDADYARDLVSELNATIADWKTLRRAVIKELEWIKTASAWDLRTWRKELRKKYSGDVEKYLNDMIPALKKELTEAKVRKQPKKEEEKKIPEPNPGEEGQGGGN